MLGKARNKPKRAWGYCFLILAIHSCIFMETPFTKLQTNSVPYETGARCFPHPWKTKLLLYHLRAHEAIYPSTSKSGKDRFCTLDLLWGITGLWRPEARFTSYPPDNLPAVLFILMLKQLKKILKNGLLRAICHFSDSHSRKGTLMHLDTMRVHDNTCSGGQTRLGKTEEGEGSGIQLASCLQAWWLPRGKHNCISLQDSSWEVKAWLCYMQLQWEIRGTVGATLRCKLDLDAAWEYSRLNVDITSEREAKQQLRSHGAELCPAKGTIPYYLLFYSLKSYRRKTARKGSFLPTLW